MAMRDLKVLKLFSLSHLLFFHWREGEWQFQVPVLDVSYVCTSKEKHHMAM